MVGAGLMGRWHAAELSRAGGTLVAVVDREASAAAALARGIPTARPFDSLDEVLEAGLAEAIHVCTPTDSHVALVERSLAAGAHVLVEKPLAPDPDATEALLERAEVLGLLLCPVHQYLFQPGVRLAERELAAVGPLAQVESTACSAGGRDASGAELDGIAADILPHPLALLERLLPGGLAPLRWHADRPRHGELRASAVSDGTGVSICVSLSGRPPRNELRMIGDRGTIHLDLFHGYGVLEPARRPTRTEKALHPFRLSAARTVAAGVNLGVRALRREPAFPGLRSLIERFYDAIRNGGPVPISPAEALAVARARDALLMEAR